MNHKNLDQSIAHFPTITTDLTPIPIRNTFYNITHKINTPNEIIQLLKTHRTDLNRPPFVNEPRNSPYISSNPVVTCCDRRHRSHLVLVITCNMKYIYKGTSGTCSYESRMTFKAIRLYSRCRNVFPRRPHGGKRNSVLT